VAIEQNSNKIVQMLNRSLENSLHVGSMLSRDRIIVVRTRDATRGDLIIMVLGEKRGHLTTYRGNAHEIVRHRFNMSSIFVRD
jgi:hypothetical protein